MPLNAADIQSLASSNECPTESQANDVRALQQELIRNLANLEEEKRAIGAKKSEYLKRKAEYIRLETLYKAILAPFRTIPLDLLPLIMHSCSPPDLAEDLDESVNTWKYPLRLAQVCRLWRNYVENTPSLWNSYRFIFHIWQGTAERQAAWRNLQVERSLTKKALHVSMLYKYMTKPTYYVPTYATAEASIATYIAPHTHRITTLSLVSIPMLFMEPLIFLPPKSFPVLESLMIEYNRPFDLYRESTEGFRGIIDTFLDAPLLRQFKGIQAAPGHHVPTLVLPLAQLTYVSLQKVPDALSAVKQRTAVLKHCVALEELVLGNGSFANPIDPDDELLVFEHLHTLTFTDGTPSLHFRKHNLDKVRAPSLKRLDVTKMVYSSINSLVRASSCMLTSLTVTNAKLQNVSDLTTLLEATPMLEEFTCHDALPFRTEFFQPFSQVQADGELYLCPSLERLVIRRCMRSGPIRSADKAVADMVEARWAGRNEVGHSRKLKKFHLEENKAIKGQPMMVLERCQEEGLDFMLEKYWPGMLNRKMII